LVDQLVAKISATIIVKIVHLVSTS